MKKYASVFLIFLSFTGIFAHAAHADTIPFFSNYPKIDTRHWYSSNGWVNGEHQACEWRADAISVKDQSFVLTVSDRGGKIRPLGCAEIHTTKPTGYGTYEASIRTAAGSGLNTAYFIYGGPPVGPIHDEIDFEFLGKNAHTVQLNYFIGSKGGHEKIINLGFDASADFHTYTIDWQPLKIRWYVDGKLVHQTPDNAVMPSHPGLLYLSLWAGTQKVDGWLGPFTYKEPVDAEFAWVKYDSFYRKMSASNLSVLYLTHDLSDPAVRKRVVMLQDGGATVTLAGFRREPALVESVAGCKTINLGQTYNGGFIQRIWSVIRETVCLKQYQSHFTATDVIIARNLEMLALGVRGRSIGAGKPTLVYECLDIHRLLLKNNPMGRLLRILEGWLSRRASVLITSSPAFIHEYFNTLSHVRLPIRLVENKVYNPSFAAPAFAPRPPGPPWKIGWFGAIRCRKSLHLLTELVRQSNGAVEVIIRGRPSLDQFDDFHKTVKATPGLTFLGPYKNPDDLAAIYHEVHFTWAIDMFEEGLNSSWLLPNRLYEGGMHGSVPIAFADVETGHFLKRLGMGVLLTEPKETELADFFNRLTPPQYQELEKSVTAIPPSTWLCTTQDCKDLVAFLGGLAHG